MRDPYWLNRIMEIDRVVQVHPDGSITTAPGDVWAPDLQDGQLLQREGGRWSLLDGYGGQQSYSGPVMHASEFVGGRMADDIAAQPGMYVAVVNRFIPEGDGDDEDDDVDGWAVAYRPADEPAGDVSGEGDGS